MAPWKHRTAWALASVGIASTASSSLAATAGVRPRAPPPGRAPARGGGPPPPGEPPRLRALREPLEHLGGRELAVAPEAEDAAEHGHSARLPQARSGREHERVAERARQAGLVAVR